MSTPDPAAAPADEPAEASEPVEAPSVVEEAEREVTLQRSVRVGRVVIGAAIAGALIAALVSLLFPVEEGAEYTLGQVTGFAMLIGAAIGLGIGGLLVLVLSAVAKRQRGTGVAIQSDVR
ncbi:hypothetical protein MUN76_06875 [Leucobacter rhizosphaerae]|uniref:MFS transporter n=1 Tax=Leucobacter rhizosphaerae TaxID=2932245 RepID=A0ABY4FZH8_9MICO|nr:hypothetical protein [Leucobacter rhizosphaerae]UOQ61675.1 hypothetical protein MUN76_06875 [Leucobacter rhizosphaerae]